MRTMQVARERGAVAGAAALLLFEQTRRGEPVPTRAEWAAKARRQWREGGDPAMGYPAVQPPRSATCPAVSSSGLHARHRERFVRAFLRAVAGYQAQCHDCGVLPGEFHVHGCDEERCPLCRFQLIGCDCVYEVNGLGSVDLEEEYPDVYDNGPTEEMYAVFDAAVAKRGGYIRWKGESEGLAECRARGWWSRAEHGPDGRFLRYVPCGPEHADAHEDLNRWGAFLRWGRDVPETGATGSALR